MSDRGAQEGAGRVAARRRGINPWRDGGMASEQGAKPSGRGGVGRDRQRPNELGALARSGRVSHLITRHGYDRPGAGVIRAGVAAVLTTYPMRYKHKARFSLRSFTDRHRHLLHLARPQKCDGHCRSRPISD